MSGHTPGPWYVGAQNDYFYVIDRPPRQSNDYPDHEADTELVAKPFAARGASIEANARLIAAAPELLDALVDVMFRHVPFSSKQEYAERARAAIAKATNQQGNNHD